MEYLPNNDSDKHKQAYLCKLLWDMSRTDYFKYFDLFAGEGTYHLDNGEIFEGAAMLALDMILELNFSYQAYLNEKDPERRKTLEKSVEIFKHNTEVNDEYQKHICRYIQLADKNSLFFIDPTHLTDYKEEDILEHLPDMLATEATLFLYAPESVNINEAHVHGKIINEIFNMIKESDRQHHDYKAGINDSRGYLKRIDHNIVVYPKI